MIPTDRRYPPVMPGKWASALPSAYFTEMKRLVADHLQSNEPDADGRSERTANMLLFGRMEIAQTRIMPWLASAIPDLAGKRILEIGCGTGSATVPLALGSRHVYAFDIVEKRVELARARCALLDVGNVSLSVEAVEWPTRYVRELIGGPVDVVVCYALVEHLLPLERIDLLRGAWRHLPMGGHFVIVETPNRLYPFDWHSSGLMFMDSLPDEIAYLWNAFSERMDTPPEISARTREAAATGNRARLYREGRGVSFHEFHTVLGADSYKVVSSLDRMDIGGANAPSIALLGKQLAIVKPEVHPGFAYPSLDLVIEKTGPARLP